MAEIETIDISDPHWNELSENDPDVHYLKEYLIQLSRYNDAECKLFLLKVDGGSIGYPLFLKGTEAVSPWYYGGPVISGVVSDAEMDSFHEKLKKHLRDLGMISSFIRINPYARSDHIPEAVELRKVYWIDTMHPEPYDKKCRNAISRARRDGIIVKEWDIEGFHTMYSRNMEEKEAPGFYRFPIGYLHGLKKGLDERLIILKASLNDRIVSGAIFIYHGERMYYYLAARDRSYGYTGAQNLIVHEAVRIAKERGTRILDLGGGPPESGLEGFKRSFTTNSKPFRVLKIVHDRESYREKCLASGIMAPLYERASYFPEYPTKF